MHKVIKKTLIFRTGFSFINYFPELYFSSLFFLFLCFSLHYVSLIFPRLLIFVFLSRFSPFISSGSAGLVPGASPTPSYDSVRPRPVICSSPAFQPLLSSVCSALSYRTPKGRSTPLISQPQCEAGEMSRNLMIWAHKKFILISG